LTITDHQAQLVSGQQELARKLEDFRERRLFKP
jgi:hypothetical protein